MEKVVETYVTSNTAINQENKEDVQIIVPKEENDLNGIINLVDAKTNQKIELQENEICLTDKAAELLGVKQGDTITLKDSKDKERQVKISNIVENYVYHYIYMDKAMYEEIFEEEMIDNHIYLDIEENLDKQAEEDISKYLLKF